MEYYSFSGTELPKLLLAGDVTIPAPNRHFERKPSEFILYFIRSGNMQLMENNTYYNLLAGDLLILDPAYTHYGIETASDISYFFLHFTAKDITPLASTDPIFSQVILDSHLDLADNNNIIIPKYQHFSSIGVPRVIEMLTDIITTYNSSSLFHTTDACVRLMSLLIETASESLTAENTSGKNHVLSERLVTYLQENCRRNLSSKDIENEFHMNFDHLNRRFKQTTGLTIINYHNNYRILEAKKLLRSSLYSIKEISDMLGFSNEFYFSRVYKKYEGIAPSHFK